MRADIHNGPEHMLQSEAGYIDARPLTPARQNLLQRTAGPYIRVRFGTARDEHNGSALPRAADSGRDVGRVLRWARTGLMHRSKQLAHFVRNADACLVRCVQSCLSSCRLAIVD